MTTLECDTEQVKSYERVALLFGRTVDQMLNANVCHQIVTNRFLYDFSDTHFYIFLKGAIKGGKRGLVPCNMIAQVDVPDGATLEALYARGFLNSDPNLNVPKQPENSRKSNGMEKSKKR